MEGEAANKSRVETQNPKPITESDARNTGNRL